MVTNRQGSQCVSVIGLLAGNKVDSLGLWNRQLHEILNRHLERCLNGFGACVKVAVSESYSDQEGRGINLPELTIKARDISPPVDSTKVLERSSAALLVKYRE